MNEVLSGTFFSLTLCLCAYLLGVWVNRRTRLAVLNPLLVAVVLCIAVLKIFHLDYGTFAQGSSFISLLLTPAVVALALPIYRNLELLRQNLIPVLGGALVGAAVSLGSITVLCKLLGVEGTLALSLLPKSVTTPIAMEVSEMLGGAPAITVSCVIFTGIFGAVCAPLLLKLTRADPLSSGVGLGACAHGIGTARALELDDSMGAMAGVSVSLSGVFTALLALFYLL